MQGQFYCSAGCGRCPSEEQCAFRPEFSIQILNPLYNCQSFFIIQQIKKVIIRGLPLQTIEVKMRDLRFCGVNIKYIETGAAYLCVLRTRKRFHQCTDKSCFSCSKITVHKNGDQFSGFLKKKKPEWSRA